MFNLSYYVYVLCFLLLTSFPVLSPASSHEKYIDMNKSKYKVLLWKAKQLYLWHSHKYICNYKNQPCLLVLHMKLLFIPHRPLLRVVFRKHSVLRCISHLKNTAKSCSQKFTLQYSSTPPHQGIQNSKIKLSHWPTFHSVRNNSNLSVIRAVDHVL